MYRVWLVWGATEEASSSIFMQERCRQLCDSQLAKTTLYCDCGGLSSFFFFPGKENNSRHEVTMPSAWPPFRLLSHLTYCHAIDYEHYTIWNLCSLVGLNWLQTIVRTRKTYEFEGRAMPLTLTFRSWNFYWCKIVEKYVTFGKVTILYTVS